MSRDRGLLLAAIAFALLSCRTMQDPPPASSLRPATPPPAPVCDNHSLTSYPALLVLAPHPDDEVLGFAGLIDAYRQQGKPVRVVVATDGDAYCEACRFWKSSSLEGPPCNAEDLSNFATAEIDSFAEVRRGESTAAAAVLGLPPPAFLGYPDTGLGKAWLNFTAAEHAKPLRRSDFSRCGACDSCPEGHGYAGGPETDLTANTLMATLQEQLAAVPSGALLATTHWLDGHPDHSAMGNFVKLLNEKRPAPHAVAYAVIHAHTPKTESHSDCWYPTPTASICPCTDEKRALADGRWIERLSSERFRPDWPAGLPDDAEYGTATHLCLPQSMHLGPDALKLAAVRSYASQLGRLGRDRDHPEALSGLLDCSGYLMSFVRSTEVFVLAEPAGAVTGADPSASTSTSNSDPVAEQ